MKSPIFVYAWIRRYRSIANIILAYRCHSEILRNTGYRRQIVSLRNDMYSKFLFVRKILSAFVHLDMHAAYHYSNIYRVAIPSYKLYFYNSPRGTVYLANRLFYHLSRNRFVCVKWIRFFAGTLKFRDSEDRCRESRKSQRSGKGLRASES